MGGVARNFFNKILTSIFSPTDENGVATILDHPILKALRQTVCAGYLGLDKALRVAWQIDFNW